MFCFVCMFFNERVVYIYKLSGRIQNKVVKNKIEEGLNDDDDSGSYPKVIR